MDPETTFAPEQSLWTRRSALKALAVGAAPLLASPLRARGEPVADSAADPPYRLAFTGSLQELVGDLDSTERGDPLRESSLPHSAWYTEHTRRRFGAWGPEPRSYTPLANLTHAPLTWQRERVVATAARFLGYAYQYHHIPDWNPPCHWPWKECCAGHNGKGVDCSNLTSFVFNQGFGIRISSAIHLQAERSRALESPHAAIAIETVTLPKGYDERLRTLQTGDLLYVRGRPDGPISHVVIWVGSVGRSPSGVPLLIDSHGSNVDDDSGQAIPCGVQLRPFRRDSWYNHCASHAHRIFGTATV